MSECKTCKVLLEALKSCEIALAVEEAKNSINLPKLAKLREENQS